MMESFTAVVPMLCVTVAALAVMGAEAFRARGENLPVGGLGIVGLVGAAAASVLLWDRNAVSFGVIKADNLGLFVTMVLLLVGVKMLAHPWLKAVLGGNFTLWVLLLVVAILAGGVIASLVFPKLKES